MTSLHKTLLEKCKYSRITLADLKPSSREIAQRLLVEGELYVDERGCLRSNSK